MEEKFALKRLLAGCGEVPRRKLKFLGLARGVEDAEEGEDDDS